MRFLRSSRCLFAILLVGLLGCGKFSGMQGSGNAKTEPRPVAAEFTKIRVQDAIHLDVTIGEKASIEVSGDDNLLPLFLTEVKDGTLTARFDGSYSTKLGLKVKVVMVKLDSLHGSGATRSTVAGLAQASLAVDLSRASNATITGKVEALTLECSGASKIAATGVTAEKAVVSVSGASTIEVNASKEVTGSASGASTVRYTGSPGTLSVSASGASTVKQSN